MDYEFVLLNPYCWTDNLYGNYLLCCIRLLSASLLAVIILLVVSIEKSTEVMELILYSVLLVMTFIMFVASIQLMTRTPNHFSVDPTTNTTPLRLL